MASTISIYLCSRKQIDMKELTSKTINWLRMALVILVLFVHVHPDHNPHWLAMDHLAGQSLGWVAFSVIGTLINKLGFIAVPLFFAISGYLFSRSWKPGPGLSGSKSFVPGCGHCWSLSYFQRHLCHQLTCLWIQSALPGLVMEQRFVLPGLGELAGNEYAIVVSPGCPPLVR